MSAVRSRAVMGASRWLEAKTLPESSVNTIATRANAGRRRLSCMGEPLGEFLVTTESLVVRSAGADWIAAALRISWFQPARRSPAGRVLLRYRQTGAPARLPRKLRFQMRWGALRLPA